MNTITPIYYSLIYLVSLRSHQKTCPLSRSFFGSFVGCGCSYKRTNPAPPLYKTQANAAELFSVDRVSNRQQRKLSPAFPFLSSLN